MPDAKSRFKPSSAVGESSSSSSPHDEVTQLERHLQRQLQEDVARIFDESIYSDHEVVCGKLKILTHSCILKARTHTFHDKLEAISHVDIDRKSFDEIYSFISDTYTECNIHEQEKEINKYLDENLNLGNKVFLRNNPKNKPEEQVESDVFFTPTLINNPKSKPEEKVESDVFFTPTLINNPKSKPEEKVESDVFFTPNCVSPEERNTKKTQSYSPSTELTKEYYALVPIDGHIFDKELIEQDALSNAFQSLDKTPIDISENKQYVKPTSLLLNASHISTTNNYSKNCDDLREPDLKIPEFKKRAVLDSYKINNATSQIFKIIKNTLTDTKSVDTLYNKSNLSETSNKVLDPTYSPDSFVTEEHSSSSDYLSAAYADSPGAVSFSGYSQLNVGENAIKMDNIITISDSGLENSGMPESLNSNKDVTTDESLTESTFHDMISDDANWHDSTSSTVDKNNIFKIKRSASLNSPISGTSTGKVVKEQTYNKSSLTEMSSTSTKEEKQRQNEEIVILESSSLSSETGSWESVFPPKLAEKELCEKFITSERHNALGEEPRSKSGEACSSSKLHSELSPSLVQKYPYKSVSWFINAASLADEDENKEAMRSDKTLPESSRPVPYTAKRDPSPNEWSEGNDNEDSLEQTDNKDPDSLQKDLSPTIFESTPIADDSLCGNTFETLTPYFSSKSQGKLFMDSHKVNSSNSDAKNSDVTIRNIDTRTPENSIISVAGGGSDYKMNASEIIENDRSKVRRDKKSQTTLPDFNDFYIPGTLGSSFKDIENPLLKSEEYPIISGGASVEDHLPQIGNSHFSSPLSKRKIENIPIVSGAYIHEAEEISESHKSSSDVFWVVDMSSNTQPDASDSTKPNNGLAVDNTTIALKTSSKQTSSEVATSSFEYCKSLNSMDSDSSEKSTRLFYIDLSTLPDALSPEKRHDVDETNEKKNIFPLYINMCDKVTTVKEMPARLSSSLNSKKSSRHEIKPTNSKGSKTTKISQHLSVTCMNSSVVKKPDDNTLFAKLETLCNDPNINITDIIGNPNIHTEDTTEPSNSFVQANDLIRNTNSRTEVTTEPSDSIWNHNDLKRNPNIHTQITTEPSDPIVQANNLIRNPNSHKEVKTKPSDSIWQAIDGKSENDASFDLFVKLSDLDKPAAKEEPLILAGKKEMYKRMTRSIPDNDWKESNQTLNAKSSEIISSFHSENALSLNRLFPNLKHDFSRSMPGSLSSRTRSPLRWASSNAGDIDEQASDMSEMSSVQSSYCRSVVENSTTEDTEQTSSLITNCQSRLGQDLLRMFLEEISPDVIVEVAGRRIKAHKCILSSRCQYFAGILSGGWVESSGNVISLPPFSYKVVHFALCHIYSGVSMIPESISITELATIADMLCLEGLKEALMLVLKSKYCHHFHKPCSVCTISALDCFTLTSLYGLDDLYRKCLRWIAKYFYKIWPTKAFAALPSDLLNKCFQEHLVNLSMDNIIDTIYGCGITMGSLPNSRWCEVVAHMCKRLEHAAAQFAGWHLSAIICAMCALPADMPQHAMRAFDDCLEAAIQFSPPEKACRAYALLCKMLREDHACRVQSDLFSGAFDAAPKSFVLERANNWRLNCENALVHAAPSVVVTEAFKELPADLSKRLRELGCIVFDVQASAMPKKNTRHARPNSKAQPSTSRSLTIDFVRDFVPYKPKPQVGSADLMPRQVTAPNKNKPLPKVRTTKAQEERAKFNLNRTNQSQDRLNCKPTARTVYEKTKPRYMEPRPIKEQKKMPLKKPQRKLVSSSESSCMSSPSRRRVIPGTSQDGLASRPRTADPSTDSLTESQNSNIYATYTKKKPTEKRSVESIYFPQPSPSNCPMTTSTNSKAKVSKIPVYTKLSKSHAVSVKNTQCLVQAKNTTNIPLPNAQPRNKTNERKPSGSLMNATKSSQAKVVPKIAKETHGNKNAGKPEMQAAGTSNDQALLHSPPPREIPIMQRSGTFLKDEPMFGDIITPVVNDVDE